MTLTRIPAPRALALAAATASLAACASLGPRLPEPPGDALRESVRPRSMRCGASSCAHAVTAGERHIAIDERTRTIAPEELAGRTAATVARRAGGALVRGALRRAGVTTARAEVGLGTRTLTDARGTLDLVCDVAWLDEDVGDAEREGLVRIDEGLSCAAHAHGDRHTPRWTVRGGMPTGRDSLAKVVTTSRIATDAFAAIELPLTIERLGDRPATYDVAYRSATSGGGVVTATVQRWEVRRSDGRTIAVVHRSPRPEVAVDIGAAAELEEADLVRLIAAWLAVPLRSR